MRLKLTPVVLSATISAILLAGPAAAASDQTSGAALMSAIVKFDATLVGGAGAVSAFKPSTGTYQVVFNRSVDGCTSVVSFGSPTSLVQQGMATVIVPTPGSDNTVSVLTLNTNGAKTDSSFMLIVFCAQ